MSSRTALHLSLRRETREDTVPVLFSFHFCFTEKFIPKRASATDSNGSSKEVTVGKSSIFWFQKKNPSCVLVLTSLFFRGQNHLFLVSRAKKTVG